MPACTQERLHKLLDYDPGTGDFIWRKRHGSASAGQIADYKSDDGYIQVRVDGRLYQAHRLAWFHVYGQWPPDLDHRNRMRTDNRIRNLRPCTKSQNQANRPCQSNSKSGFKGVFWSKRRSKWYAQIKKGRTRCHIGQFDDPIDAAKAYDAKAVELHGEFAHLNFPKGEA